MREFVESNYEIGEVFKIGDLKRRNASSQQPNDCRPIQAKDEHKR